MLKSIGLYIHIPWCVKKCPYCDFNSHAVDSEMPEKQYIDKLLNDLQQDLSLLNSPRIISSIFIGGGTPSLFSADAFERLLAGISALIPLKKNLEITLEANPGTFESDKFSEFRNIGINRLSIGIQSFHNKHLQALGRIHSAEEAMSAIEIAQLAGFDNLNLDLMFGLPKQSNKEMLADIQTAIELNPNHISFYQLTLEPNTYFHKFPPTLPEHDQLFSAQTQCQKKLADAGYHQYEISAYSKNNKPCEHNVNYWQFGDYLGIGAGAHGKISLSYPENIIRTTKEKSPAQYLMNNRAKISKILSNELPLEFMMNQLRLKAGFNIDHFKAATGLGDESISTALSKCINKNLLLQYNGHYICSDKGWNFLDTILEQFIP